MGAQELGEARSGGSRRRGQGSDLAARVTIKCAPGHGSKGVIVGTLSSGLN